MNNQSKSKTITTKPTFPNPTGHRGELDHHPPSQVKHKNQHNNQQSLKHKANIKVGTFNVRSLSSPERFLELTHALESINCDILGLAEVRRLGCSIEEHDDFIFCYIGQTKGKNPTENGHGGHLILTPKMK
ncbi:uncharacterized protein LOC123699877 [Colias croceus]|uniref:uncharacterized protein LOC123699877 n=1 Tax=Colias crocea TaxID=72248 RepID=UPI001E279FBD|nr:uncharacterized protein LOC123699877 [Colias croceus]